MKKESIRRSIIKIRNSLSTETTVESQNKIFSCWKTKLSLKKINMELDETKIQGDINIKSFMLFRHLNLVCFFFMIITNS